MKGRILVVDDDEAVRLVLGGLLEQDGHHVERARSGRDALARIVPASIDVVLTDVRMPGMSGMELLERVRAEHPEVPVVMLTAHGSVPLAVEAMRAGATDFLTKPFEREEVLRAIAKAMALVAHDERAEDLYFRLVVVPVDVPALRDRRSDIRVLARAFFVRARAAHGREDWRLDDDALDVLAAMPWPGNVRELQNAIERLVILGDGPTLDARAVGRVLGTTDAASDLRSRVREAERGALIEVLESTDNRAQAARVLGISRRTLYNKLEEHGLL